MTPPERVGGSALRIACASWSRRRAGGMETYLEWMMPALAALGHQVSIWTEHDAPADRPPIATADGMAAWCAARDGLDDTLKRLADWRPSVIFVQGLTDPRVERRLGHLAPTVLLAHSYYGTCISGAKTHVRPLAPCSRTFGPACVVQFYPRRCGGLNPVTLVHDYRTQARRLALARRHAYVLTLSGHMRSEYLRHGIAGDRVIQLPPYVPPLRPPAARVAGSSELRLLFVGRIDRLKGCAVAIEALRHVRQRSGRHVRLRIAGDGPDRSRCEALAHAGASEGVRVEFCGWVDEAARDALLASTDVLVFPSLWPEPYGLAGLEARAAGVPVAAFPGGAVPEWLREGIDGALAPPHTYSPEALAEAILRCSALGPLQPWTPESTAARRHTHARALAAALTAAADQSVGQLT